MYYFMKKLLFSFFFSMLLFVWSGTINVVQGQISYTWTQTAGGTQLWTNGANWLGGTAPAPVAGDTLNFNAAIIANTPITMGSTRTAGVLNIGKNGVNFNYNFSNTAWNLRSTAANTLGTATINVNGGAGNVIQGNVSLQVEELIINNNVSGGSLAFWRPLQDGDGDGARYPKLTVNGVANSGYVSLSTASTSTRSGFKYLVINENAIVANNSGMSGGFANDVALGINLTTFTPDAITIDGGSLVSVNDGTFRIQANRGITLTSKGGTIMWSSGGRHWEMNSIITGAGPLTVKGASATAVSTVTLNAANTYSGNTTIKQGTLALGASGSINSSPLISISEGGVFDVSTKTTYTLNNGSNTTLSAAGAIINSVYTPATIKGGTTLDMGSQAIELTYTPASFAGDLTRPALTISQGALTLNNNTISVNNAGGTALGVGTYRLIAVTGGTITGTPNASVTVSGSGLAANTTASLEVSGGYVNLVVTSNLATYNVTYDGNGKESGSVPADQTKILDTPLTLQTNSGNLIISGKNFDGWNTAADGSGTSYAAGGTYEGNEAVTLYAKWLTVDTYTISFDGNGNTGGDAPANQTKTQNVTQNIPLTLAANSGNLVKAGYSFAGWNTASDGSGTSYAAGGSFTTDATTTLYAIWVATVTETFDTEASATEHGWRGSNNTTGGNDFKWSNTSTVSGSAGEAGGSFARSGSFRSYANTTIGSYSRTNVLKMSGSFKLNNADFDGSFYIGYFKSGSEATNFAGIAISEPSGGASNPFRGYAAVNITGQTRSSMIELTQNTTYSFDLSWLGNADGSGTLSGTVAGTPVNVAVAAGSGTFDAFGLMCGGFTDVSAQNTINCYFDDLTYNMNSQIAEWNGTAWSNGGPNSYKSAVVSGSYSGAGFTTNNLTVNGSNNLTISSGKLDVQGNLVFATDATFGLSYTPATFDGDLSNPALIIPLGTLSFNNTAISVNNASGTALGEGTYRLIDVTGGTITGSPNSAVTVTGDGIASGKVASLAVSGGYVNLVVVSDTGTGIGNSNSEHIPVFVNSGNQLVINGQEKRYYEVYNTTGVLVEQGLINSQQYISGIALQPGMYIVKVNNIATKIVVNK
jgi:autotransporter-associated beta strand protein